MAILVSTPCLDPFYDTIFLRQLKLRTISSFILTNVSADTNAWYSFHWEGLLCIDLHAIFRGSFLKVISKADHCSILSGLAINVIGLKSEFVIWPVYDADCFSMVFTSWGGSPIIIFKKTLKVIRYPWHILIFFSKLFSYVAAMMDCVVSLVVEALYCSDQVGIDVAQHHAHKSRLTL